MPDVASRFRRTCPTGGFCRGGGATDLGGCSANGDHISPSTRSVGARCARSSRARLHAHRAALRLPQYMDAGWIEQGVLDVIKLRYWSFIPRRGSGRREERAIRRDLVPAAIAKGRAGAPLGEEELTALFAEMRPEAIEEMRQAADELRRELAGEHRDLRREPQHQRVERLHGRLRVLRVRPGEALARRLRARPRRARAPGARGGGLRGHRDLHAVGDPSRLGPRGLRALAARGQGGRARDRPARLLADGGRAYVRRLRPRPARGVRAAPGRGPRVHARHRGGGAPRRRARADLAEQAPGEALGRGHRGIARGRACARRSR